MTSPHSGLPSSLESLFADTPEVVTLDNGLTVVFQQNLTNPVVSVQTWIKSGSIHEGENLGSGLSHFLEHMLFKGTHKRGAGEIAAEVQAFGGQINAYTAFDRTVYYIDGPSEAIGQMLELLSDQTLNASIPEDELEKEREVILREIDMTLDDPDRIVSRAIFSTAFGIHPFRYPVIGLRPLFKDVSRNVLFNYYKARYQPANMVLAVAGHFDRDAFLEEVNKTFGQAPPGSLSPLYIPGEPDQIANREIRKYGNFNMARGLMGFKIPSMRHEDSPGLDIMSAIIGSGYSARLRQKLRDELELVHGVSASAWNPAQPGLFFIQYQSDPDKAATAEKVILETCQEFTEKGFSEKELNKARRFAFVSEVNARQTCSGMASRIGLISSIVGDLHYPRRYFEIIHSLTTDKLRELASRTFVTDQLTTASLLPEEFREKSVSSSAAKTLPPFEEKVLSNGARLCWQRDSRLPRVYLKFAALGGPQYEERSRRGATSLLCTMLNRDTDSQSAFEISEALESNGGFMSDSSGNNTFGLSLELMPEGVDQGIEILRNALFRSAFTEDTLHREKDAQVAHLKSLEDDVMDFGRLALRRHFFGEHPFADSPCGQVETTEANDEDSLRELKDQLLVGSNAVLVVSGDIDPEAILPQLEKLLSELPKADFTAHDEPFDGPATTGQITETVDREQAVVFEAYPDIGLRPNQSIVGDLFSELLSDMSGPLFRAVREDQSLAYYVGASRLLGINHGCFYLYAGTHPSSTEAVYDCFEKELNRIRAGELGAEEIEAARTRLKIGKRFALQSPSTRASMVAMNALFQKPIMNWLDYEKRLEAIQADDLSNFANKVLSTDHRLRLTVTPN